MLIQHLRAAALAALLVTTACATTPASDPATAPRPAQAAVLDPAGTYTFNSEFRGQSFEGVVRVAASEGGAYTGTLTTPFTGALPVRSVDVQGKRVRVTAQGRMGDAVLNMDVDGGAFTGTWAYGPSTGQLTGRVRPAS